MGTLETITHAAVQTKDGAVYTGMRHATIKASIMGAEGSSALSGATDGFTTSTGRFVDRDDASKIASKAGQTHLHSRRPINPDWPLYSEDLW